MDGTEFPAAGSCPACGMPLVSKASLTTETSTPFEPSELLTGSHAFLARGGAGRENKRITVHYHKPRNFTAQSKILLVIPGAGRDGDEYRDAWVDVAEASSVLVAGLTYPEANYDFAAYQMGGVIKDLVIKNMPLGPNGQMPDVMYQRDEDISFSVSNQPDEWIFGDLDRIFGLIKAASKSAQTTYDAFGHSAGGQILHRLALFHPHSKANRIIAANGGLYTQPDLALTQPAGMKDNGITTDGLRAAFAERLTLLLGELDNSDEAGGTQIHTPLLDRYGKGRLDRGKIFFEAGKRTAEAMDAPFNWTVEVVPNVGHDFRAMSRAAARLLYR